MPNILEQFRKMRIDPRETSLKVGIFGAEPWSNKMRAEIEDAFNMDAVDIYGLSEVLPDGELGELVFTTLTKEGQPMIRFRTRDLTRLLPGTARTMRRMEKATGRSDDMIIIRGVNLFPTQIEELVLNQRELAPYFQIELNREARMDSMRVHVEAMPSVATAAARKASSKTLSERIKSVIGVSTEVVFHEPGVVEHSQSKARRVIDNRSKG